MRLFLTFSLRFPGDNSITVKAMVVKIRITNIENNDQCKMKTKITFGNQYLFSHFAHFKGTLLKDTIVKIEIILYMNIISHLLKK